MAIRGKTNGVIAMKETSVRKLSSRKLWVSVANFVSMLMIFFNCSESEAAQVAALIMAGAGVVGYIVAEGLADASPSGIVETETIDTVTEDSEV